MYLSSPFLLSSRSKEAFAAAAAAAPCLRLLWLCLWLWCGVGERWKLKRKEGRREEGGGRKLGGWEEIDRCGVLSERVNFNPKGIAEDRLRNEGWAPAAASLRRLHSGFTPALERGGRQNIKGMEMICPAAV